MDAASQRMEFAPPPTRGLLRALGLALLAHLLLLAALTAGMNWKRESVQLSVEAELWSALPQQAAPRLVDPPPPPPAVAPAQVQPPPAAVTEQADIAAERERELKARREQDRQLAKERELQARQKALAVKAEQQKAEKLRQDKLAHDKEVQQKAQADARAKEEVKAQEARRQENLRRIAGLAGASGAPAATGTAQQSSGPSASYGGRIRARIKPNIVFTEDMAGNPTAEVEVRTAPDGTIIGRKLIRSSGHPAWDQAVLRAIDKTEVLPRDEDGRVPPSLVISFRPRD